MSAHLCFGFLCLCTFACICVHMHLSLSLQYQVCLLVLCLFVYLCSAAPPPCRPAPTPRSALSPSDRLALCQERMFVFESCQDIKHGRSPTRGRIHNKLAASSKVRGNMTSQSASLIGSGLLSDLREWMDPAVMVGLLFNPFSSRGKHLLCPNSIPAK